MEFEILNKRSDKVAAKKSNCVATITFTKSGRISFSAEAVEVCNLRIGSYLHFAILNKTTWMFFINNDNSGYKLFNISGMSLCVLAESVTITRLFKDTFKHDLPARYFVQVTTHEHQGHKMFEILTHKPLNKIGK